MGKNWQKRPKRRKPIVIAIPMEKVVLPRFMFNFNCMEQAVGDREVRITAARTDRARNDCVKVLMDNPEFSHILFIDSDQLYPPNLIERLLAHKKPVVGCLYFRRGPPYDPMMYQWTDKTGEGGEQLLEPVMDWTPGELLQVGGIGTGGLLIERSVFEQVPYPWFYYGGLTQSEDITFCHNLTKLGIPIYCDTATESGHLGEMIVGLPQFVMYQQLHGKKVSDALQRLAAGEITGQGGITDGKTW